MEHWVSDVVAVVATCSTMIGMTPQIYKAYKTGSTRDLSKIMLGNNLVCSSSWLTYGVLIADKVICTANIIAVLVSITLISQKYYYDRHAS